MSITFKFNMWTTQIGWNGSRVAVELYIWDNLLWCHKESWGSNIKLIDNIGSSLLISTYMISFPHMGFIFSTQSKYSWWKTILKQRQFMMLLGLGTLWFLIVYVYLISAWIRHSTLYIISICTQDRQRYIRWHAAIDICFRVWQVMHFVET